MERVKKSIGWDDPLPQETVEQWNTFFCDLFNVEHLKFQRCMKTIDAVGKPTLVIFSLGSTEAYIRWELKGGGHEIRLIAAKNRLAPFVKS